MAGREASFFQKVLYRLLKFEQANGIGDRGAVLSAALRDLFLREAEFIGQALEGPRLLNRVQILALKIFHERHFQRHFVANVANDGGNTRKCGSLRRSPSAFACNQLEASADPANNDRLNDTARPDGASELFKCLFAEMGTRLIGAWIDQVDIDLKQAFIRNRCWCYRRCPYSRCSRQRHLRLLRRLLLRIPYQRAQSPAQRVSGH